MIIEYGGGKEGLKEYLESGRKVGRAQSRDELDERRVLIGDLEVAERICNEFETEGNRYRHLTLSFTESDLDDNLMRTIIRDVFEYVYAGYSPDEYYVYAERHVPRIKSVINEETGETVIRCDHVHLALPMMNLVTGKRLDPIELMMDKYSSDVSTTQLVDACQEHINQKYSLASPKDHRRADFTSGADIIARSTGESGHLERKDVKNAIRERMIELGITDRESFRAMLAEFGQVEIGRGRDGDYFKVKPEGHDKFVRLKGEFFSDEFIGLSAQQKRAFIDGKFFLKPTPAQITERMAYWRDRRCLEIKHLHTDTKFYKQVYCKATDEEKLKILRQLDADYYKRLKDDYGYDRNATGGAINGANRDRLFDQAARSLRQAKANFGGVANGNRLDADAIGKHLESSRIVAYSAESGKRFPGQRSEGSHGGIKLAEGGNINDNQVIAIAERAIRTAGRNIKTAGRLDSDFKNSAHACRASLADDAYAAGRASSRNRYRIENTGGVAPGSSGLRPVDSVVGQILADRGHDQILIAADRDASTDEIKRNLSATRLLAHLSKTHGVQVENYPVSKGRGGRDLIKCGTRNLTVNDFLTKEMHLHWKDAEPILRVVYEAQQHDVPTIPMQQPNKSLWKGFQYWKRNELKDLRTTDIELVKKEYLASLDGSFQRYSLKRERVVGDHSLSKEKKRQQIAFAKAEWVHAKKEAKDLRDADMLEVRGKWDGRGDKLYPLYLAEVVQGKGDMAEKALAELRRRKPDIAAKDDAICYLTTAKNLPVHHPDSIRRDLAYKVDRHGVITYQINGKDALRDDGRLVRVLDSNNVHVIEEGLMLAKAKFGNKITLNGSDEFKRLAVQIAVEKRIAVDFIDPELQRLKLELEAAAITKRQAPIRKPVYREVGRADKRIDEVLPEEPVIPEKMEIPEKFPTSEIPTPPAPIVLPEQTAIDDYIDQCERRKKSITSTLVPRKLSDLEIIGGKVEGVKPMLNGEKFALVKADGNDHKELVAVPIGTMRVKPGDRIEGRQVGNTFKVRSITKGRGVER